jgi:hypothetical protein
MARSVLRRQTRHPLTSDALSLDELEGTFQHELADAREWHAKVRENELTWIREGKDPEWEFARTYYEEPAVTSPVEPLQKVKYWSLLVVGGTAASLVVFVAIVHGLRRRSTERLKGAISKPA